MKGLLDQMSIQSMDRFLCSNLKTSFFGNYLDFNRLLQLCVYDSFILLINIEQLTNKFLMRSKPKSQLQINLNSIQKQISTPQSPIPKKYQKRELFRQSYQKSIKGIIDIYENITSSKIPQKCLSHSLPLSLYCQTDHKFLCSRCMQSYHKLHQMRPIAQAQEQIGKDCEQAGRDMEKIMADIAQMKKYIEEEINAIQRQYPEAKEKIEGVFKQLHQMLFDQQKQCMRELRIFKITMLEQQNMLAGELANTQKYIQQKMGKYKGKFQIQELLTKKNVFEALKQTTKVINQTLSIDINTNQPKYKFDDKLVDSAIHFFEQKFKKLLPWEKQIKIKSSSPKQINKSLNNQNKISNDFKKGLKQKLTQVKKNLDKSKTNSKSKSAKEKNIKKSNNKQKQKQKQKQVKQRNTSKIQNHISPVSRVKFSPGRLPFGSSQKSLKRAKLMVKDALIKNNEESKSKSKSKSRSVNRKNLSQSKIIQKDKQKQKLKQKQKIKNEKRKEKQKKNEDKIENTPKNNQIRDKNLNAQSQFIRRRII